MRLSLLLLFLDGMLCAQGFYNFDFETLLRRRVAGWPL
jgi:hypothetical protein